MINEQRLVENFLQLVHTNSPAGKEGKVADLVEAELKRLGLDVIRDDANTRVPSDTGNVIGTLKATAPGGTPVFFSAHMDTVQPTEGIKVIQDGRVLHTDGTTILGGDDKSGIAEILEALRHIQEEKTPHAEIQVVITISEEVGLKGARALDPALLSARMGYILDTGGSASNLVTQAPSHDVMAIRIIGKAAHAGASPEQGISAIQVAAKAIAGMRLGRIDAETTANIGTIQGGEARNIVAEQVTLSAEARSLDESKLVAQTKHMVDAFEQAAAEYGAKTEITVNRSYSTFHLKESDLVVQIAAKAARKIGLQPELKHTGGGSDANIYNAKGIPAIVISSGMDKVHTTEECISIDNMLESTRLVVAIIEEAAAFEGGE